MRLKGFIGPSQPKGLQAGAALFAFATLACIVILPPAAICCSRFSRTEIADRALGGGHWDPHITRVAIALLDWPMGFRLLILSTTASAICLLATLALLRLARQSELFTAPFPFERPSILGICALLSATMLGALFVLAAYVTGYFGYLGPLNMIWMLGLPAMVAFMLWPRPLGPVILTIPLALLGWLGAGVISIGLGIPLD